MHNVCPSIQNYEGNICTYIHENMYIICVDRTDTIVGGRMSMYVCVTCFQDYGIVKKGMVGVARIQEKAKEIHSGMRP